MHILQLSWKNILHKPLNLLLNVVLFALGVGLISLLLLVNTQLEEKFEKNFAGIDLVIGAKGSPLQLILSSLYHLDAPTGNMPIKEAKPFLNPKHPIIGTAIPLSLGDSHKGYRIVGTSLDFLSLYGAELSEGKLFSHTMEAVIGATVAARLQLKPGDSFQSTHGLLDDEGLVHADATPFRVTGMLKKTGSVIDQLILTRTESVWAVHNDHDHAEEEDHADHDHAEHDHAEHDHPDHDHADHDHAEHDHPDHDHPDHDHPDHDHAETEKPLTEYEEESITTLLVKFRGRNIQALNFARNINENTNFQAATPAIEINRLYSLLGVGEEALRALALLIIFVSGLSIFISIYSSLRERRYEMALMRTLGSGPGFLFRLILLEGLVLALVGYAAGMSLSRACMVFLADFLENSYRYDFTAALWLREEGYLLIGSLLIGLFAALIPAFQASRTDIHATLADNKG